MSEYHQLTPGEQGHADTIDEHLSNESKSKLDSIRNDVDQIKKWIKNHPLISLSTGTMGSLLIAYLAKRAHFHWSGK